MKSKKLTTVTIAVSAFNEARNIKKFLISVLAQKEEGFILKKILVVSDGSTDNTIKIANSLKSNKLSLINYKKREGKSYRLNQIYKSLDTDILVQSDSDVVFSNPYVVRDIIKPLEQRNNIAMCGGNPIPLKGKTFIEKAINATVEAYLNFRKSVRGGNNAFSADGRILAFKTDFIKDVLIPRDMIANDAYTYYLCLTKGYKYKFVNSAIVYYKSPNTLNDHIRQNTRFEAAPIRLEKYFDKGLIRKERSVPRFIYTKELFKQFLTHPILCSYIYLINIYCKVKASFVENKLTSKWEIAKSTKSLSQYLIIQ